MPMQRTGRRPAADRQGVRTTKVKLSTRRLAAPLFLLPLSCATLRSLDSRSFLVASLDEDEQAQIQYETKGCWSHCRFWIVIRGGSKPTAEVRSEVVAASSDRVAHACDAAGTLELSPALVASLDATIQRYRRLPAWEENCSARNDITLHWTTSVGKSSESYVDDPCSYPENAFSKILELVGGPEAAARPNQPVQPTAEWPRLTGKDVGRRV